MIMTTQAGPGSHHLVSSFYLYSYIAWGAHIGRNAKLLLTLHCRNAQNSQEIFNVDIHSLLIYCPRMIQ